MELLLGFIIESAKWKVLNDILGVGRWDMTIQIQGMNGFPRNYSHLEVLNV
jgi:hypothetical protein